MLRRQFLSRAGVGLTYPLSLATIPVHAATSNEGPATSLEQRFAEYALAVRYEALPPEVVIAVKRIVLDTFACAFGAVGTEAATIAEATIRSSFGDGQIATVIGNTRSATVEGAVFVNGVLVRSLDLNDTYLGSEPLHPSELLPTALALCEEGRRSGQEFISALVAGYEVSMRVTDALSYIERGFHPLCSMAYGAPVIAGRLMGLKEKALANAVGLSAARGYTSFVVNSGAISMMKAMGFAASAVDALFVTRLAANGFTGPRGTLEWFASRSSNSKAALTIDMDPERYRIPKVAFKRFPIQIELAAVAEAGSLLSAKLQGRITHIQAISVETYPGIIERVADADKFLPQTRGTADHSLPVCLAMAILDGDVTLSQFEKDRWRSRDVMALVEKTKVTPSATLMAKMPKGRGASVEVTFANGTSLRETVEVPEGDSQRPLSRVSLERKFMTAAIPVVGEATAKRIVSQIESLETLPDIAVFARLLKGRG